MVSNKLSFSCFHSCVMLLEWATAWKLFPNRIVNNSLCLPSDIAHFYCVEAVLGLLKSSRYWTRVGYTQNILLNRWPISARQTQRFYQQQQITASKRWGRHPYKWSTRQSLCVYTWLLCILSAAYSVLETNPARWFWRLVQTIKYRQSVVMSTWPWLIACFYPWGQLQNTCGFNAQKTL